ncbi:MAG TPA: response regulator transcription factor [Polyangiaceae bacterium]|nr:response regulator transcription factor [Polyangiaceae bacterium]
MESSTLTESPVLLIDDDEELGSLLSRFLEKEGFEIHIELDGSSGLARAQSGAFCAVILDVMMPGMNGFDLLRELRRTSNVPVVMLTARGQDVDRIVGLEMGADDYLAKPFNPRELAARLRAIQRRVRQVPSVPVAPETKRVLIVGDVELNPRARVVKRSGDEVTLTSVEFALLEILMRAAGHIVSREDLSTQGLGRRLSQSDRSIDVHVSNLRKKLGACADGGDRIKTVRGFGYQYTAA